MFRLQRFFQRRNPFLLVLRQTHILSVCLSFCYLSKLCKIQRFNLSVWPRFYRKTKNYFFFAVIFVPERTTTIIKERNDDGINNSVTVSLHAQRFFQEVFPSCSLSRGYILSLLGLLSRTGHGTCSFPAV